MSSQKLIIFQAGLIKLCNKQTGNNTEDLERRIAQLEDKIRNGVVSAPVQNSNRNYKRPEQNLNTSTNMDSNVSSVGTPQQKATLKQGPITQEWPNVLNELKANGKIMLYTNLLNTNAVEINDMTVGIEFQNGLNSFGKAVLERTENKSLLEKEISMVCGKPMNFKLIDLKEESAQNKPNANAIEETMSSMDIPFDVIE